MIVTRIIGGLGNQMFQYAAGRALAIASQAPLKLDLSEMEKYKLRSFALDQFKIQVQPAKPAELPARRPKTLIDRVSGIWNRRPHYEHVVETSMTFDPTVLQRRGEIYLSGYWQSEKYFSAVAAEIRSDFNLKGAMSEMRDGTRTQIVSAASPVSVHVRRGDYVTNPAANAVHGTCPPEWYDEAMSRMQQRHANVTFFIFSDDPQWARENLHSTSPMHFVEPQGDGRDGEDMHLMAACHDHIIANSSFSWWGAWLNPRMDKHVIAPRQWFKAQDKDDRDIIPASWERL
ncbi:alpha-1,2-fucosyltransferase [Rhizobium sp. NTR19]|uniref:Alpha-1,2-fucosyltransferase n=1 Tax=Neorhizobium turbinariae TaxID=2937795 RepID=A0ABT0IQP4_9HYPH|nr:alpha-1,2-fucosyltransferase [Neorhizobium turbinariae]MCK8780200.1 alpha-1,2-fucosyltransferase [Neorhizobium turbinariae]